MSRNEKIRTAVERVVDVFRKKPSAAMDTIRAAGRIKQGLICNVRQGDYKAVMDMATGIGGDGSAPTPGFFIRAGLVGCIAIGIKLTAAREGLDIGAIDVGVEMDFDDGAMLGVGDNSAAPLETRVTITVESTAPWEEVKAMIGRALECDPYFWRCATRSLSRRSLFRPGPRPMDRSCKSAFNAMAGMPRRNSTRTDGEARWRRRNRRCCGSPTSSQASV